MSDRMNDVLAAIDAELTKCICGEPLQPNGPSFDYCSEDCQEEWQRRRTVQEGFQLASITEGELRPGATTWSAIIPVTFDFIDHGAINDLIADLDHADPRVSIADNLSRIQQDVWSSLLVNIWGGTTDAAYGDIEDGEQVHIGFDANGDTITWAVVSGGGAWRTGSFPIPEDADRSALAAMGQVAVKGRWSTQPTDRSTT